MPTLQSTKETHDSEPPPATRPKTAPPRACTAVSDEDYQRLRDEVDRRRRLRRNGEENVVLLNPGSTGRPSTPRARRGAMVIKITFESTRADLAWLVMVVLAGVLAMVIEPTKWTAGLTAVAGGAQLHRITHLSTGWRRGP
ncbi:hypothetical protein ABT093_33395 [Kitasatospora sp. NPDC002551]|uniref:hypothetical protein n=1 Tax=unclassified Kitasatospora TaxID=2633591 RepID=UPI00331DFD92